MRAKSNLRDLIERVELMESALERTITAIRDDLAGLREDLEALETDVSTRPTKPPAPVSGPTRTVSEELALRRRAKDPRSDD